MNRLRNLTGALQASRYISIFILGTYGTFCPQGGNILSPLDQIPTRSPATMTP